MAGFEVVVRPMVLPNIRPTPSRVLPAEDDPEKRKAVITGGSGKLFQLSYSYSGTATQVARFETKRQFDVDRVYQPLPYGQATGGGVLPNPTASARAGVDPDRINKDNYVDVERIRKVWFADGTVHEYATPPPVFNVETLARDQLRHSK